MLIEKNAVATIKHKPENTEGFSGIRLFILIYQKIAVLF